MSEFSITGACSEHSAPMDSLEIIFKDKNGQFHDRQYPLTGDTDEYICHCGPLGAIMDICYWLSHDGSISSISIPTQVEFDFDKRELIL